MKWIIAVTLTFVATGAFGETMASDGNSSTPKIQTTPNTQTTPSARPEQVAQNSNEYGALAKALLKMCQTDYPSFRDSMTKEISKDIESLDRLQIKADENHDGGWVTAAGHTFTLAEDLRNDLKQPFARYKNRRCNHFIDRHEEIHRTLRKAPNY